MGRRMKLPSGDRIHMPSQHETYDVLTDMIASHPVIREATREWNSFLHHLLEEVLFVQEHEDWGALENRVLNDLLEKR